MQHALVTGAGGFLGRHLLSELARRGVMTTTLGRNGRPDGNHIAVGPAPWHVTVLAEVLRTERPDAIFHLAGTSTGDAQALDEVNWGAATSMMQAMAASQTRALLVCCGSAAEYGDAIEDGVPAVETAECRPQGHYGASKLAQTRSVLAFSKATGTPVAVARIFNPIGAGLPRHLALADFAWQIAGADNDTVEIRCGNLEARRDYVAIDDVASTMCAIPENPAARGVINVCSGTATRIGDLVEQLGRISGRRVAAVQEAGRMRPGERRSIVGSTVLLEQLGLPVPKGEYAAAIADLWEDTEQRRRTAAYA